MFAMTLEQASSDSDHVVKDKRGQSEHRSVRALESVVLRISHLVNLEDCGELTAWLSC